MLVAEVPVPGSCHPSAVADRAARDVLPRPGGGQSSHSIEAAVVLVGLMGAQIVLCFFSRSRPPQIQFINRDVHNPIFSRDDELDHPPYHQQSG